MKKGMQVLYDARNSSAPSGYKCQQCGCSELTFLTVGDTAVIRCCSCKRDIPAKALEWPELSNDSKVAKITPYL